MVMRVSIRVVWTGCPGREPGKELHAKRRGLEAGTVGARFVVVTTPLGTPPCKTASMFRHTVAILRSTFSQPTPAM
jgi:hypothetical protein